jgi:UDP-N-acetylglucosamine 2-epimerase (non-hydrolysing)
MTHILHVVGARPNFVKISAILRAMQTVGELKSTLVHTSQHYGQEMSDWFFEDMKIRDPDFCLGVGSGTHAEQTARIMLAFEPVLETCRPDLVLVVGDVNSTLACALVAAKLHFKIAHVEAGLRSFDRTMPEEINRILTDQLSDVLFTTSADAGENLRREGIRAERIHFVGNVMIDTLRQYLKPAIEIAAWKRWSLEPKTYAVVTLHRPSNVDDSRMLLKILETLEILQEQVPIIFPVHPRTRASISGLIAVEARARMPNVHFTEPLRYLEFIGLLSQSAMALTDSGGIQEECTSLGIPCLTLRSSTERPVTVTEGTNVVVGTDRDRILAEARAILMGRGKTGGVPALWDGQAAQRIVDVLRLHPALPARDVPAAS